MHRPYREEVGLSGCSLCKKSRAPTPAPPPLLSLLLPPCPPVNPNRPWWQENHTGEWQSFAICTSNSVQIDRMSCRHAISYMNHPAKKIRLFSPLERINHLISQSFCFDFGFHLQDPSQIEGHFVPLVKCRRLLKLLLGYCSHTLRWPLHVSILAASPDFPGWQDK